MPLEILACNSPPLDFSRITVTVILINIIIIIIVIIIMKIMIVICYVWKTCRLF